jgi:hypothetical protein
VLYFPGRDKMKPKILYKGMFRLNLELHVMYLKAYSKEQAKVLFCRQIAKKTGVMPGTVLNYFDGSKDSFEITEE